MTITTRKRTIKVETGETKRRRRRTGRVLPAKVLIHDLVGCMVEEDRPNLTLNG